MTAAPVVTSVRTIALVGNPNSGKSTIFNHLTGLNASVGNYQGVTVEKRVGRVSQTDIQIIDLPGIYSLSAVSPDEVIARSVIMGLQPDAEKPDAVLVVLDAASLERNLYLATQILELGLPVIVACNMMDVARRREREIDCAALSQRLGVPVVPTNARNGDGVPELRAALEAFDGAEQAGNARRPWPLPQQIEDEIALVSETFEQSGIVDRDAADGAALVWLTDYLTGAPTARVACDDFLAPLPTKVGDAVKASAQRVLDGFDEPASVIIQARYDWISQQSAGLVNSLTKEQPRRTVTDRVDSVLTHRLWGLGVLSLVMAGLFYSIFALADPIMGLIESAQGAVAGWVVGLMPAGTLQSLLVDGVINGVGSVLIFLPQICILFLFLSILEDSGYMARAAFMMDRLMARVGLHGRSFIPLLSSFACAIPGILATRTIENPRDRLTTILIAPLMSCSARLPVYIIVIGAVFGQSTLLKAGVLFGMYALGTIAALAFGLLFKKTLLRGPRPAFIMELPPYRKPKISNCLRAMWERSRLFVSEAGTTIFAACIVIWALSYFPRLDPADLGPSHAADYHAIPESDADARANYLNSQQQDYSLLGRMGHWIEPVIEPLGFDWRLGTGILSSFAAREVFVGTMGITFSLGEVDETSDALRDRMATATWPDGRKLLTPLVGVSLMVFYVFACQCISTLAVVRKETGTWRWPIFLFVYMTVTAYLASLAIYQTGRAMGWA